MSQKEQISYQTINSSQIYLNSANADILLNGANKSNVVFFFNDTLNLQKNSIEMRISVVNAQIPVSFYLINSTNNTFTTWVAGVTVHYVFPVGNYNVTTFISTLLSLLPNTFTVTFNSVTNTLIIVNTSTFTLADNNLAGVVGVNSLLPLMGFVAGQSYPCLSKTLVSPYSVNFGGLTKINIESTTFNFANLSSYNCGKTNIICTIPVSSPQNGFIFYNNYTMFKSVFKCFDMPTINIQFTDDQNNYIQFNNIDWTVCLQIDIVSEVIQSIDTLNDVYENAIQELV